MRLQIWEIGYNWNMQQTRFQLGALVGFAFSIACSSSDGAPTCGHYTQVVWRSSILLGCGIKSCSTNTPFGAQFPNWYIVVCNHSPAGNNGSRPY